MNMTDLKASIIKSHVSLVTLEKGQAVNNRTPSPLQSSHFWRFDSSPAQALQGVVKSKPGLSGEMMQGVRPQQ